MKARTKLGLVTVCGSLLLGLPLFSTIAKAEPIAIRNSTNGVKKLCVTTAPSTPTAASNGSQTFSQAASSPRVEQQPSVNAAPRSAISSINVTLVNKTNAPICYQALRHTDSRILEGQSEVRLETLPAPLTVTFYREDGGLLQVSEQKTRDGLILTLSESRSLTADRQTLVVDDNGTYQIF